MTTIAIYPGTFDPITLGHQDVLKRASQLFSHIILAVANSAQKDTLFTTAERVQLARHAVTAIDNVEICQFDHLITDLARERKARVIIRGLRAVSDFDYEFQLAGMNRCLFKDVETIFLSPAEHLSYLSSSLVKEIAALGGNVSDFVHPRVLAALHNKNMK